MNKLFVITICVIFLLAGCQKKSVEKPIVLSCKVKITTYDDSNKWGKRNFYEWNESLIITISKNWIVDYKTGEKGWQISSNKNMDYYPHSGDGPNQKGQPWWLVKTSVDKNLILGSDKRGNDFDPDWKNSYYQSLSINRITGEIEEFWEYKSEDKSGYISTYHHKLKGICEPAQQKF